ncbi:hypothetical protein CSKR_105202 [Clonorchis sinensis]|uniref:Uncharacterized protein n=1 Tax=Clonorchis sinensis TaxID=79923 RepID=A0A8T1M753_CLOSI|nr:hypothetical protein CSKR_105202 [Clonorchis sinensis]KAG5444799.1 hypothetical protein CSKR_105202 [Clonorchis sinensis]
MSEGKRLDWKLFRISRELKEIVERADNSSSTENKSWSFSLAEHILISVLRELRVRFTVVSHSALCATAALSAKLKCPVIGSCSDYFIMVSSTHLSDDTPTADSLHSFVPLHCLDFEPVDAPSSEAPTGRPFLSAHIFDWKNSTLNSIAPRHRILLALLMGCPAMPRSRLPPEQNKNLLSANTSGHPKEHRFSVIYDWLNQFDAKSTEPVEHLIEAYPEQQRNLFIQQLADCIPDFIYHLERHSQFVATKLQLPELSYNEQIVNESLSVCRKLDTKTNPKSFEEKDIFALLSGVMIPSMEPVDFTAGWPARFQQAYQEGRILTSTFRPLYGPYVLFRPESGFVSEKAFPQELVLPIRVIHYCLLLGFERQLGGCEKLIGLSPHVTEYHPRGDKMVSLAIPVSAITINTSHEQTDRVLSSLLGLTFQTNFHDQDWIFGFAVTLAFCRAQWSLKRSLAPVSECSLTLALVVCAVVNVQADIDRDLLGHYLKLTGTLEDEYDADSLSSHYRPGFINDLIAIQCVYVGLWSLVSLIESMLPLTHESEHFHFLPLWRLFPSIYLVHWLAVKLETHPPGTRCHIAIRYWLPRLYHSTRQDAISVAAEFRDLVSTFNKTMDTVVALQMSPVSPKHTVHDVELPNLSASKATRSPSAPDPQSTTYYSGFPRRCTPSDRARPFPSVPANWDRGEPSLGCQQRFFRAGKTAGPNRYPTVLWSHSTDGHKENSSQRSRNPTSLSRGPRLRKGSNYSTLLLSRLSPTEHI